MFWETFPCLLHRTSFLHLFVFEGFLAYIPDFCHSTKLLLLSRLFLHFTSTHLLTHFFLAHEENARFQFSFVWAIGEPTALLGSTTL